MCDLGCDGLGSTECGPWTQLAESAGTGGLAVWGGVTITEPGSWRAAGSRGSAVVCSCLRYEGVESTMSKTW